MTYKTVQMRKCPKCGAFTSDFFVCEICSGNI